MRKGKAVCSSQALYRDLGAVIGAVKLICQQGLDTTGKKLGGVASGR